MLYHELLPSEVIDYVERNKNCEDIAMNFLISDVTGKSPLKVTPRKNFVCPGKYPLSNIIYSKWRVEREHE